MRQPIVSNSAPMLLRVLILEDNPSDAMLMEDALKQMGYDARCERVETKEDFAKCLSTEFDLILSDYALPQFNGIDALKLVRTRGLDVPFVLVSGSIGEDIAVDAMRHGANDYLLKDRMARLGPSVQQALKQQQLAREREQAKTEQRNAETRYTDIFESVVHGIAQLAPDGQLTTVNPALAHMLGYQSAEELIRKVAEDGPDIYSDASQRRRYMDEISHYGVVREFETELLQANGSKLWVSLSGRANHGDDGEILYYLSIVEDITTRKRHEQAIERLSRTRAVNHNINYAITRIRNRQALFDEVCRIAIDDGKFGMAWIGDYNALTSEVTQVASAGLEAFGRTEYTRTVARADPGENQPLVSAAILETAVVYINDLATLPGAAGAERQEALRRGYHSVIALPLTTDGAATGVLCMFVKEVDFFDHEEVALLTGVAENLSFALEHIARLEKIQRLNRVYAVLSSINAMIVRVRDRQTLFNEACRIAVVYGGFDIAWIGAIDPAAGSTSTLAWSGVDAAAFLRMPSNDRDTVSSMIRKNGPAYCNDISTLPFEGARRIEAVRRGYKSVISLPLRVDNAIGYNLAIYASEENFFTVDEVKLLSELADDISFSLEAISSREKIEYLSFYDDLTGLPNRTLFLDRISQQSKASVVQGKMLAVIQFDIARFHNVNETLGRQGGDEALKLVAHRLKQALKDNFNLARISAGRFAASAYGVRDAAEVAHIVENQILASFGEPFLVEGAEIRVAARAGIALFPSDGTDADALFRNAEAALRNARNTGERFLFYTTEMNARAAQFLSLETRLRTAMESRQFVLYYQPKFELATRRICGLEALIRWQDPERGLVPPGLFIPILEETGLILDVGNWVVMQALTQHRLWTAARCKAPRIAVNVSPIQLQQKDFVDKIVDAVRQAGNTPEALELEITESVMMNDIESNIRKLSILRGLGIHVSMDDFGTGYSSLSNIGRLPIDKIKIDRSFVTGMTENGQDRMVTSTIITLAHSLGLRVVAEGVETEDQAQLLKQLKCEELQGYLLGKPLPAHETEPLLRI